MSNRVIHTRQDIRSYSAEGQAAPLVTVAEGHCAARVTFNAILPTNAALGVFAEVPSVLAGNLTSIAIRLLDRAPTGQAMVTPVSPRANEDGTAMGAFMSVFLEGIMPTTVGPPMYRRTEVCSAYYNTSLSDEPGKLYVLITGGTNLAGAVADVILTVVSH